MRELQGVNFFKQIDRQGGLILEGVRLGQCRFDNCSFSLVSSPDRRSMARNLHLRDCRVVNCDVGPAIVDEVVVENLAINDLLICWGTLFRHVTLSGKLGSVKTNAMAHHDITPDKQASFDTERAAFYEAVDWALDISAATFTELDLRGIPARLIRRDPSRQFVLTRRKALEGNAPGHLSKAAEHWMFSVELFLRDGDEDRVLTVPHTGTRKRQAELLEGLLELRRLGLVEPD